MNKSEIFCSKSIYFFYIVCLVCVTCRRASFGTLCPPCGMIYGAIPLPYLWYWPSFVQPFSHISPFQSLNLFNLLHFSHLIKRCPGYILRNSASSFHWLSSSIFTVCWLSRIGNTSSHPHYMMFQTIQTIYFLWGYDPGNMSVSFIAELSPAYCCLVLLSV